MKKAYIFDFDGTLSETIPMTLISMRAAFEKLGEPLPSDSEIYAHFGATEYGILQILRPKCADKIFAAYLEEYKNRLPKVAPDLFPQMRDTLEKILSSGARTALVTGKHQATADFSIDFYGIGKYFEQIRYGAPRKSEKTERIRSLMENEFSDCEPSNVYYLGDMPSDVIDSYAAGAVPLSAAWSIVADIEKLEKENPRKIFRTVKDFSDFALS